MKCKKTEHGVEFIAESDHERDCLDHLVQKHQVTVSYEDRWNRKGSVIIEGRPHPWDK